MSDKHDPDCIFCKIVAREIPAAVIFEDGRLLAFCDAFPAGEGHALVVPKAHHENLFELPVELVKAVSAGAQRLALAQRKALEPDGLIQTQFNGKAAGQTVFHYHVHCIPRWAGTELILHGREQASPETLQAVAEKIRAVLD